MKDRPDSSKGTWYRRAPRANKVEPEPAVAAPAPTPRATYGTCAGETPELFACVRAAPDNIAAKPLPKRSTPSPIAPSALVARVEVRRTREPMEPASIEPKPAQASEQVVTPAGEARASVPDQGERASEPAEEERTTLTAKEAPVAESVGERAEPADEVLSEDDVIVVGEADDLEFIPVADTAAAALEEAPAPHDTPAVLPTTLTTDARPALGSVSPTAPPQPRSRPRAHAAAALAIAACASLALWAARDWVSASLEGPRAAAALSGKLARHAKLMRFDVPELVVVSPAKAPPTPAVALGRVAAPVNRAGGPKDAAALAELEKLAAGLPSGDGKKK